MMRVFVLSSLLFCTAQVKADAEPPPPPITPVIAGPAYFTVKDCTSATLALRVRSRPAPVAVRTADIPGATWTLRWSAPTNSDPALFEYETIGTLQGGCPDPGTHEIPLRVWVTDAVTPIDLAISLERTVDPVLDAPATVTLAARREPMSDDVPDAVPLTLHETSGIAAFDGLAIAGSELKNKDSESTGVFLTAEPAAPAIAKGGKIDLKIATSAPLPAGVYTGRFAVRSPQLPAPHTIEMTYRLRVAAEWLIGTILVGIGLGWLFNVALAKRSTENAAKLAALRVAGQIVTSASLQKDPVVQQRLTSIANTLQSDSLAPAVLAEEIDKKVKAAQDRAAEVITEATQSAAAFGEEIGRVRSMLSPNGPLPDATIALLLAKPLGELDRIEGAGKAGDIETAREQLRAFVGAAPRVLFAALSPWLVQLNAALNKFGDWSASTLEAERAGLQKQASDIFSIGDTAERSKRTDNLARQLRSWLIFVAPGEMAAVFRDAALQLEAGKRTAAAVALRELALSLTGGSDTSPELLLPLQALTAARLLAEQIIMNEAPGNVAIAGLLGKGNFTAAARDAVTPPQQQVANEAPETLRIERPQEDLPAAEQPQATARLISLPTLIVGAESRVELITFGIPDTVGRVWSVMPQDAAEIHGDAVGATLRVKRAGFVEIAATLGNIVATARVFAGDVRETSNYAAIAGDSGRIDLLTNAVAAVLTAFVGYQVFVATWYGSFGDFFTVFAWGFFGQFGLDRVRQATQTIVSRTLP